tara:strand:- start:29 stop:313 length:285 start_codon:yes stop_codon:yes gene_type:complete
LLDHLLFHNPLALLDLEVVQQPQVTLLVVVPVVTGLGILQGIILQVMVAAVQLLFQVLLMEELEHSHLVEVDQEHQVQVQKLLEKVAVMVVPVL